MNSIPKHIAIIPDGNRRWAKNHNMLEYQGHSKGADVIIQIAKKARDLNIEILTIWGFSTENWGRSNTETNFLMKLFENKIEEQMKDALQNQVRLIQIGRKDRFSLSLRRKIIEAEEKTAHFNKWYMVFALDYGGRDEIIRGIQRMTKTGENLSKLTEERFASFLDTRVLPYPNPDLIIRTSGEVRTSDFMLWQSAYSEYIFVKKYFPDFTTIDFEKCIDEYKKRKRRFGR